jgi:FkbM family methyltransferase
MPPISLHPLWMRLGTSDVDVYRQVFLEREYACLDGIGDAKLIVDCGANVGFSAAYFLSRYKDAEVVAVEPDAANFDMLQRNTAPFGDRIRTLRAGIWSHNAGLSVRSSGDGREWSFTVVETPQGETPDIEGISLEDLLCRPGCAPIDILKMDIEGSEKIVFSNGHERWLPLVRNIVIELHGIDCEAAVDRALQGRSYIKEQVVAGKLTLYRMTAQS